MVSFTSNLLNSIHLPRDYFPTLIPRATTKAGDSSCEQQKEICRGGKKERKRNTYLLHHL
jgi:hypothetical protein